MCQSRPVKWLYTIDEDSIEKVPFLCRSENPPRTSGGVSKVHFCPQSQAIVLEHIRL